MTHESWFDSLIVVGQREHYSWLANLPSQVDHIANFGCWSGSEPFALMWTLNAKEVMVVEIEEKFIEELREQFQIVNQRYPESLNGCIINSICRDMTKSIPELPDHYLV